MNIQLDSEGRLRHLLTLDGLPRATLEGLLDRAGQLASDACGGSAMRGALAGKAVCTLFFEPSTRTRSSFSLAAQRLGADLLNFDASTASTTKGEADLDTLKTLEAMGVHGFVVRHKRDGAVAELAAAAEPGTVLLNAGDGRSNHPTQGLLDMLTLRQAKGVDFSQLKVVIVGDVKHSRVARSDLLNFDASTASTTKGEADLDTLKTLEAMGVQGFVIRHKRDGAVAELAAAAEPGTVLLNAGDGRSNHPTQGLLDMLTLRQAKGVDFSQLKVVIVGDVKHSRVARSDLHALRALGCGEIRVCGPASLLPDDGTLDGCTVTDDFDAALEGVDAAMMLRLQRERMAEGLVASLDDYHRDYGLNGERLRRAAADAIVMHPGPMNRGIEITDEVADGPQSRVLRQVANGVAVRMAVLEALLG